MDRSPHFPGAVFGAGSRLEDTGSTETWSGSASPPRIAWLRTPVSPAWMISVFLSRWELQLFSSGLQRWDPLSSEPPALSIVLPSHASLAREQPEHAVPRELPAPPQRSPLLQDLPYELLETAGAPLSEPRETGSHQPTPFTPLHGGYAQTVFPEKRQSRRLKRPVPTSPQFCWSNVVWITCIWKHFPIKSHCSGST